jgi:hypothetical protein
MKKPKKTAAAKPLSRRTLSNPVKPGAQAVKPEPAATPKKATAVKKVRKLAAKVVETAPVVEVKPLTKATAAGAKPKSKTRTTAPTKPASETKLPLAAESLAKAKPATEIEPAAEIKPSAKAKIAVAKSTAKPKPSMETKPAVPIEPALAAKPVGGVKPKVRAKSKSKPVALPKPAVDPQPPVKAKPVVETEITTQKPVPRAPTPEAKHSARPARKAPTRIPPILLEGDRPGAAPVSGPGHRYALGPSAPVEKLQTEGELPESYGTGAILLTARDPHWLYAHWDLSADQQRRYNAFSRDGHLVVRVYLEAARGKPAVEVHVHPESRHWFVRVEQANTRYLAELGYYSAADKWKVVSTSAATLTPPDAVSADTSAEFGTIPFEVPMAKLLSLVKEAVQENAPLAQALQELRADGHVELPQIMPAGAPPPTSGPSQARRAKRAPWTPSAWTPAQERALAEVVSMDHVRRVWMGSLEITELIRRQFVRELASMTAAELAALAPGAPTSPSGAVAGISSPTAKAAGQPKGFWFNVNAELIVYGATEPDATVSIGGRKIKLRPDGSFSYRFALPDGNYEMPVIAVSADGTDGRAAELKFSRGTKYRGHVGAHPQDPQLRQILLENF